MRAAKSRVSVDARGSQTADSRRPAGFGRVAHILTDENAGALIRLNFAPGAVLPCGVAAARTGIGFSVSARKHVAQGPGSGRSTTDLEHSRPRPSATVNAMYCRPLISHDAGTPGRPKRRSSKDRTGIRATRIFRSDDVPTNTSPFQTSGCPSALRPVASQYRQRRR
jgi:hypothetical protein